MFKILEGLFSGDLVARVFGTWVAVFKDMPHFDGIYFEQGVRTFFFEDDNTEDVVLIRLVSLTGELLQCE